MLFMVHQCLIQVRFRDTDGMGHVNNAVYASYLEMARFDWFRTHFSVKVPTDFPFIIARLEINYKQPIQLTSQPIVELGVTMIGESSWTFEYRIQEQGNPSVVYAEATTVQVGFNYNTKQKAKLSREIRQVLEQETWNAWAKRGPASLRLTNFMLLF